MNRRTALGMLVGLALMSLASTGVARADVFDDIRSGRKLLWGGDQEGGGPYVFPRDDRPTEVTGFEVDLAKRIAAFLKVDPEFTQGQWDKMPDMLRAGKVHVIL
ncbi:MAG TPA: ABC transporter substrate-binding protein, partial [Terriglobia bacterium]|nr:ABC transporter substrate-binding protein [Terriglobia bacterium]